MKGSERAELRAEAHHLDPTVHVGQHGITPALISSLDDALRTHELVKVKLGKKCRRRSRRTPPLKLRQQHSQKLYKS